MEADNLIPAKDKWEFDEHVTDVFDVMLHASIPSYHEMRRWVDAFMRRHLTRFAAGTVVDLGASRGEAVARAVQEFPLATFHLVEVSAPMRAALELNFARQIEMGRVHVHDVDLRYKHEKLLDFSPSLVVSNLTLMFVPLEYRQSVMRCIWKSLSPGGRLIFVEKILGETAESNDDLVTEYYQFKSDNGYTAEAITRKKLSLEGVLVPLTASQNEEMLERAGFQNVQRFYQALNFAGWIAEK